MKQQCISILDALVAFLELIQIRQMNQFDAAYFRFVFSFYIQFPLNVIFV
jgi:hypothetical protein